MRIIVKYENETYKSLEFNDDPTIVSNRFYEELPTCEQLRLQLDENKFMVFGKEVLQRAIFIFE